MLISRHFLLLALLAAARLVGAEPDPIEGRWSGKVTAPQGEVADIAFEFRREASGTLGFKLDFPAMFTHGASLGIPVEKTGPSDYAIIPAFAIKLHRDGDSLTGTFSSGDLPLELHRGGPVPAPLAASSPPESSPAPLWRYALGTGTWAPPLVADGIIYVGGGDGCFHAVRAADGTALWTWTGVTPIDGCAALDSDAVYFLDTRFNLIALDRHQGTLRWRVPLHNEFHAGRSAPDNPTFNHRAATPLVQPGVIYAGSSDGGVYAIEADRGGKLWRHDAGAPVFSGIGLRDADTLMFGTMDGSAVLLDRRTRTEILRVKTGGGVVTTPVIAAGRLIVGSRDYQLYAFNLADGSIAWKFSYWFSWIESTPALHDGLLYVGGSDYARVTAIDPATGRARWGTIVGGMDWGTPLVTDRHVFTGTVNQNMPGTLIDHAAGLVKLDRATGAVLWRLTLPKAPEGHFAGYAGSLALAGDKVIAAGFDGYLAAYPAE
jgi:outer membrane protein assembly factor BamB